MSEGHRTKSRKHKRPSPWDRGIDHPTSNKRSKFGGERHLRSRGSSGHRGERIPHFRSNGDELEEDPSYNSYSYSDSHSSYSQVRNAAHPNSSSYNEEYTPSDWIRNDELISYSVDRDRRFDAEKVGPRPVPLLHNEGNQRGRHVPEYTSWNVATTSQAEHYPHLYDRFLPDQKLETSSLVSEQLARRPLRNSSPQRCHWIPNEHERHSTHQPIQISMPLGEYHLRNSTSSWNSQDSGRISNESPIWHDRRPERSGNSHCRAEISAQHTSSLMSANLETQDSHCSDRFLQQSGYLTNKFAGEDQVQSVETRSKDLSSTFMDEDQVQPVETQSRYLTNKFAGEDQVQPVETRSRDLSSTFMDEDQVQPVETQSRDLAHNFQVQPLETQYSYYSDRFAQRKRYLTDKFAGEDQVQPVETRSRYLTDKFVEQAQSVETQDSLYADRYARRTRYSTNKFADKDQGQPFAFHEDHCPPSNAYEDKKSRFFEPNIDKEFRQKRYQLPSESRLSPPLHNEREPLCTPVVEEIIKPVPLMSLPFGSPAHHSTQPYTKNMSTVLPFHERQAEILEPLISSHLEPLISSHPSEVSPSVEYSFERTRLTSPRDSLVSSPSNNHVLSRLGPEIPDYNLFEHTARAASSNLDSFHQKQLQRGSDNGSSAFSRLGPEAHCKVTSPPENNGKTFNNCSLNSSHMSHDYNSSVGSYTSLDLQASLDSRVSNSSSILNRLGEQNHSPALDTSIVSNYQHSPISQHCELVHPLDREEQQKTLVTQAAVSVFRSTDLEETGSLTNGRYGGNIKSLSLRTTYETAIDSRSNPMSSIMSPPQDTDATISMPLPFSAVQGGSKQSYTENTSPSTFRVHSDAFRSTGISKTFSPANNHNKLAGELSVCSNKQLFRDQISFKEPAAEPFQRLPNSSFSLIGEDTDQQSNILSLAKIVIGNEIADHIDPFSSPSRHLLYQLFSACQIVERYFSKEKKKESSFPMVLDTLCSHFKGFFSGTLKSTHLPANSKILFTKELSHLRSVCGKDIPKWKRSIHQFLILSDTIPGILDTVASKNKEQHDSARVCSMSPQPLTVDEVNDGRPLTSSKVNYSQSFVGHRPSSKHLDEPKLSSNEETIQRVSTSGNLHSFSRPSLESSGSHLSSSLSKHDEKLTSTECVAHISHQQGDAQEEVSETLQLLNNEGAFLKPPKSDTIHTEKKEFEVQTESDIKICLPVTSKIPVNSVERTTEGLKSLLDIVNTGALKDELGISVSGNELSPPSEPKEKVVSPSQKHRSDALTEKNSLSSKIDGKVIEIDSLTTATSPQLALIASSKMAANGIMTSSSQSVCKEVDKQKSVESTSQVESALLNRSNKKRSLSPGEILSSSSPSPPPPALKTSDRRASNEASHSQRFGCDVDNSPRRSRNRLSFEQQDRRRRYSRRSRTPPRYSSRYPHLKRGMRTRVNKYKKESISSRRSNSRSQGSDRKYVRSKSESEDELELLDLRKKAILSMIPSDAIAPPSSSTLLQKSAKPSQVTAEKHEPNAFGTVSTGSLDNFDTVDMDVCDTHSDPGVQSTTEQSEQVNSESITSISNSSYEKVSAISAKCEPAKDCPPFTSTSAIKPESNSEVLLDMTVSDPKTFLVLSAGEGSTKGETTGAAGTLKPSFSIKVVPGDEKTWSIEPVHILPADNSDSDDGSTELEVESSSKLIDPVSDISQFLLQARKASIDSKESVLTPSTSSTVQKTVPLLLPSSKKKEYLQLKMKLEMHERKRRLKQKPNIKRLAQLQKSSISTSRAKTPPQRSPSQPTENEKTLSHLNLILFGYEEKLQRYQSLQRKNQSDLNSLTEQLTECELTIEEWDLKHSALNAQLKHLQEQIKASKAAQSKACEKKSALQSKVKMVKDKLSEADSKIKEVTSGISQTKVSIAKHQSFVKPSSDSKAAMSSEKSVALTTSLEHKYGYSAPDIIIEPVSDCDTATSSPKCAVEVEPVTDSEISDSPSSQPTHSPAHSVSMDFEAVSDAETVVVGTDNDAANTIASKCPKAIPNLAMQHLISQQAKDLKCTPSGNETVELIPAESGFKPSSLQANTAPSILSLDFSSETSSIASISPYDQLPSVSNTLNSPVKPSVGHQGPDSSIVSTTCHANILKRDQTRLPTQSSDENLIPESKIFCSGTSELFTLGVNEHPQFIVPVGDILSLYSLDVELACVSQSVLTAVQKRPTLSHHTTTQHGFPVLPHSLEQKSGKDTCVTPISDSLVEDTIPARPTRARKQRKPLKFTPERRLMLFSKEQHKLSEGCTSSIVHQEILSSGSILQDISDSSQESEHAVLTSNTPMIKEQKTQAQHTSNLKMDSLEGSNISKLSSTSDKVAASRSNRTLDPSKLANILLSAYQQAIPESPPLSVLQVQEMLNSNDQPVHVSAQTAYPSSTIYMGSVIDSIIFFQKQYPSTSTKLPSEFLKARKNLNESRKRSLYASYSSPLLCFNSYQLSPAYRHHEKLQLGSPTFSNKLDPKQILCKFEILGVCKDPKCTAQHVRDSMLTREELVASLVSNAPQLANCSNAELDAEVVKPSLKERIKRKLSSYSSSVVEQYSPMISDEEIYKLTAHRVNKARKDANPEHQKHHFISFSDRKWLPSNTEKLPGSFATSTSLRGIPYLDCVLSMSERTSPDPPVPHSCSDKLKMRYFSSTKKTDVKVNSGPSGDTVECVLELASDYKKQKKYEESLKVLEVGLTKHKKSLELWISVLHLKSQVNWAKAVQPYELSLRDVCSKALEMTGSYTVVLECIRVGRSTMWKELWIANGLKIVLSTPPSSTTTSHQCLELLMNSVLLNVSLGRVNVAMGTMEVALLGSSEKPHREEFVGLCEHLSLEDRQMACVCLAHLGYWHQLPLEVFESPNTSHIPSKIVCKIFCGKWDSNKTLSSSLLAELRQYMQKFLHLCKLDDEVSIEPIAACLPLLVSIAGFEVTHGSYFNVFRDIERLIAKVPTAAELWLLYARNAVVVQESPEVIISRALTACPCNAQLYYFAARLELLALPSGSMLDVTECSQRAVDWLERCIKSFYKVSTLSVEPLQMYRKLLGQFVPYDLKIPPLADHVDLESLGTQHAPIWMCYCLLVELTAHDLLSGDFCHHTAVDAYESAVHSLLDRNSNIALWKEYLFHLRSKSSSSVENLNLYINCTRRCLQAVDFHQVIPCTGTEQPTRFEDYTFHNEVIDSFMSSVQCTLSQKLSLLQSFGSLLPNNSNLMMRIVSCAFEQETPSYDLAQSLLATCLSKAPYNALLWRQAASIEIKLGHSREARWIFREATDALPHCLSIWTDFLVFELDQHLANPLEGTDPDPLLVTTVLAKAFEFGVNFHAAFPGDVAS